MFRKRKRSHHAKKKGVGSFFKKLSWLSPHGQLLGIGKAIAKRRQKRKGVTGKDQTKKFGKTVGKFALRSAFGPLGHLFGAIRDKRKKQGKQKQFGKNVGKFALRSAFGPFGHIFGAIRDRRKKRRARRKNR